MGTHFLGEKKLKKLSNKLQCSFNFTKGYEYTHYKGFQILVLQAPPKFYVCILKKRNTILQTYMLPNDFEEPMKYRIHFYRENLNKIAPDIWLEVN